MQLSMRVVERIKQPIQYADIPKRILKFENDLKNVDRKSSVSLGKVSIVQDGQVQEYLVGGVPWKIESCLGYSDDKMQWFADVVVVSSDDSLIERLRLRPYDDGSMLAFVLEPLKFGE